MPYQDEKFGLIYNRRGPTSIIEYGRILSRGGILFGIHTDVTKVRERLERNRYEQIEIEEYNDARIIFADENEFALFLADVPGTQTIHSQNIKHNCKRSRRSKRSMEE